MKSAPALLILGIVLVALGALCVSASVRKRFHSATAEVIGEAERTIVRHDLDNGKGPA